MKLRFYHCNICGKTIVVLSDSNVPTICCGQPMEELVPNKTDGAVEKHVPVHRMDVSTLLVRVGSDPHPMTDEHSITWVGLQTAQGFQFKELHPGELPRACFSICPEDNAQTVFAYCNLHGLWCSEMEAEV